MSQGRPTKYKEEYCKTAIDYLGSGKSMIQLARHIGVVKQTLHNWAEDNPDFLAALTTGKEYSEAYWQDQLTEMMYSKEVNAPLVKLYFANRFNWHDRPVEKDEEKAAPLNVTFEVREAVTEVKVTNAKSE